MNPRDLIRLVFAFLIAACACGAAVPAAATMNAVVVHPEAPTTCDPVTLTAQGTFGGCDSIASAEVFGPVELLDRMGPMPAYATRIRITIRRDERPCPAILRFYSKDFAMGTLPPGQHYVTGTEWVVDSTGTVVDSSAVNTTFTVTTRDGCTVEPCVILGFSPRVSTDIWCDALAAPGAQGCFLVDLMSQVPVGGVQVRIQITDEQGAPLPPGSFTPALVSTTTRTQGMQIAWEADGSAVEAMLFSTTGATIPPGHDGILRVCYGVGAGVPSAVYSIRFESSLVADPNGNELFPCPTFRQRLGRFCVGEIRQGCDLDEDGVADIRDVIRLVRCALAGDACPDTVAAHADCNGDGAVDVRDVICCVRRLLEQPPGGAWNPPQTPGTFTPLRIGFTGAATWTSGISGRATIELVPDLDFGGVEFQVEPSEGFRITSLTAGSGYLVQWERDAEGIARSMLLRQGPLAQLAPARVTVGFERVGDGGPGGELRIEGVRAVTWDEAAFASYVVTAGAAMIPAGAPAAPQVYAARPNPFTGTTEIPFSLPGAGRMSLRIFDVSGRLVRTLVDGERPQGVGRAAWDGRDAAGRVLPAGVYFAKLNAMGVERSSRILRLR